MGRRARGRRREERGPRRGRSGLSWQERNSGIAAKYVTGCRWPTVNDIHLVASRHYAFEGRCFVVAVGSVLRRDQVPQDLAIFEGAGIATATPLLAGGSAIIGPDGHYLAGPAGAEEIILYALAVPDVWGAVSASLTRDSMRAAIDTLLHDQKRAAVGDEKAASRSDGSQ